MKRFVATLILSVTVGSGIALAQSYPVENMIKLGGFDLTLGMSQTAAIGMLTAAYDLEHVETPDWWMIKRKGRPNSPSLGTIWFEDGRLAGVKKFFVPSAQTASGLVETLVKALDDVPADISRSCAVSTQPGSMYTSIMVQCGNRNVAVAVSHKSEYVSVEENLSTRR